MTKEQDYLPLPEPSLYFWARSVYTRAMLDAPECHPKTKREAEPIYTEDDMRAYVDADRAQAKEGGKA